MVCGQMKAGRNYLERTQHCVWGKKGSLYHPGDGHPECKIRWRKKENEPALLQQEMARTSKSR